MKILNVIIIALIFLNISCKKSFDISESKSTQIDSFAAKKMEQDKLTVFGEKYANAWSGLKPEKVAEFYASNASLKVNDGEPAVGTEAITAVAKGFMDAFPDMIVVMDSIIIQSNNTRFYWTLTGTNNVSGGTGNKVEISGFEEWIMNENGLVQESKGHFNSKDYSRQLNGGKTE